MLKKMIEINHKIVKSAEIIFNDDEKIVKMYLDPALNREAPVVEKVHRMNDDEKGDLYILVPNFEFIEKNPNAGHFAQFCSWSNVPADAANYVKNGIADTLLSSHTMFSSPFVRRNTMRPILFLNRKIGEEMRKKTLEGWGDINYKYSLCRINKNSFSGLKEFLRKDYKELKTDVDGDEAFCFFESECSVDGMGRVQEYHNIFKEGMMPSTEIYLADTEEEIEKLIPEVQDRMIKSLQKCIKDGSELSEINEYSWKPFQFILIEDEDRYGDIAMQEVK